MSRIIFTAAALFAVLMLDPDQALAWGPGVHMALGEWLIANAGLLSPFVADLIVNHRDAFLYGALSADIFIGKGAATTRDPFHSHNWDTGFRLLDKAATPEEQAMAHGYLVHLAADVTAHNLYVPNLLDQAPLGGKFGHVYIEMQADMKVKARFRQARELMRRRHGKADKRLCTATDRSRLNFYFKKGLFRSSLAMCASSRWSRSLQYADRTIPLPETEAYLADILALTGALCLDFLKAPRASAALAYDPMGAGRLPRRRLFKPLPRIHAPRPCLNLRYRPEADLACFAPGDGSRAMPRTSPGPQ